jgi:hypothetical protein
MMTTGSRNAIACAIFIFAPVAIMTSTSPTIRTKALSRLARQMEAL